MSRTKRGQKASGFEYWTARPFNLGGGTVGQETKKRTAKAERRYNKREAEKRFNEEN